MLGLPKELGALVAGLKSGKRPQERETVMQCLGGVLVALLDSYADNHSQMGRELRHLARAAGNEEDPLIRRLSFTHATLLNQLLATLERLDNDRPAEEGRIPKPAEPAAGPV